MSEDRPNYGRKVKTIFRTIKNEDNPFVMIDRRPIENPILSWKAKGILAYLLSRPDNWTVRLGDLVKRSPDGVHAVRGAINELKKAGHVRRVEHRDPQTKRITEYTLEVYELPFTSKPLTNFLHAENLHAENLTLNDIKLTKNELKNGAEAPNLSDLSIEWQIAGNVEKVTMTDETHAKRVDFANLVAMGTPAPDKAREIALTFQNERDITLPESKVKAQRKAIREMLEMGVTAEHVRQAVQKLLSSKMTFTDLFGVIKTSVDLATKPQEQVEYTRLL